jgi:hypothetical protein
MFDPALPERRPRSRWNSATSPDEKMPIDAAEIDHLHTLIARRVRRLLQAIEAYREAIRQALVAL